MPNLSGGQPAVESEEQPSAAHSAAHGAIHSAFHKLKHHARLAAGYLKPKLVFIDNVLDISHRMQHSAGSSAHSPVENLVCPVFGTTVRGAATLTGGIFLVGSNAVTLPGRILLGGTGMLGAALLNHHATLAGNHAQGECHNAFALGRKFQQSEKELHSLNHFLQQSPNAEIQNKQRQLAGLLLEATRRPQSAAFKNNLDKNLRDILGEKNDVAVRQVKKEIEQLDALPTQAKNLKQEYKNIPRDEKSKLPQTEKFQQSFHTFSQAAASTSQLCYTIGKLTGNPALQKIGAGIGSVVQIASSIPAIFSAGASLAAINPIIGVFAGCAALSGLFGDNEADNGMAEMFDQVTQAIVQPLYAMWAEFRHEFKLLHEEIHMMMEMIGSLHNTVNAQHQVVVARLEGLSRSLNDSKHVLREDMRNIHLEPPHQLCTQIEALINSNESRDQTFLETLRVNLFHWLRIKGGLCRGLQTGMNEKAIDIKCDAGFNQIKNVIKDPAELKNLLGFLAEAAQVILRKKLTADKDALPPIELWCELTRLYIFLNNRRFNNKDEDNSFQLDQIAQTGVNLLQFINEIQNTPDLFTALFKGYQDTLTEIQGIVDQATKTQNTEINSKIEKVYPTPKDNKEEKIAIDLGQDVTTIVNSFKGKMPLQHAFSISIDGKKGGNFSYSNLDSKELKEQINPELILLARLGVAPITIDASNVKRGLMITLSFKLEINPEITLTLHYVYPAVVKVVWLSRTGRYQPDTAASTLWDDVKKIVPSITSSNNIAALQATSKQKVLQYIHQQRKAVEDIYTKDAKLQTVYDKLDSYLKLLQSYAHLAGFQNTELQQLQKLCDSEQIKTKLKAFANDRTLATTSPHADLVPELRAVQTAVMAKLQTPNAEYFNNKNYQRIYLTLVSLGILNDRAQQIPPQQKPSQSPALIDPVQYDRDVAEMEELLKDPSAVPPKVLYEKMRRVIDQSKKIAASMRPKLSAAENSSPRAAPEPTTTTGGSAGQPAMGSGPTAGNSSSYSKIFDTKGFGEKSGDFKSAPKFSGLPRRSLPGNPEPFVQVDVTGDGSCLPYSVTLSYLLPMLNDKEEFSRRCKLLFGKNKITDETITDVNQFLRQYKGEKDFITTDRAALEVLVDTDFRQQFTQYMRDHKADFSAFFDKNEDFESYLQQQAKAKQWCGQHEINAISALLQVRIEVYEPTVNDQLKRMYDIYGERFKDIIYLVHTGQKPGKEGGKGELGNHYEYLIPPRFLNPTPPATNMPNPKSSGSAGASSAGDPFSNVPNPNPYERDKNTSHTNNDSPHP